MKTLLTLSAGMVVLAASASASFILLDDFESYAVDVDLSTTGNWSGASDIAKVSDFGGNQFAEQITNSGTTSFLDSVTTIATPANSVSTVFFQMQIPSYTNADGLQSANNVSLRDSSLSASFGNNRNQLAIQQTAPGETTTDPELSWRSGAEIFAEPIAIDTWFNFWIVSDTSDGTWSLYQNTGNAAATGADLVASGLDWRSGTNSGSVVFSIARATINTVDQGALIDNIYYDTTGMNLANPIPEPSVLFAVLFGGVAVLALVVRRRA